MIVALFIKETGDLLRSKAGLLFNILAVGLAGFSFQSAVELYSNASVQAIGNPFYSSGFEPVQGVFTPTFGGLFIAFSLLLPFVFIQLIGTEKRQNTLALLYQLPCGFNTILLVKAAAGILFLVVTLGISSSVFIFWFLMHGHLYFPEIALLLSGYFLYGCIILALSLFISSLFSNTSTASLLTLFAVLASWIIDFAKDMNISPLLMHVSNWSFTANLKPFENGILSLRSIIYSIFIILFFYGLTYLNMRFDLRNRWRYFLSACLLSAFSLGIVNTLELKIDVTESSRNSFPSEICRAIAALPSLSMVVYLEKTDSRFKDWDKTILQKLLMIRPGMHVDFPTGAILKRNYGKFVYTVNGKSGETFSNSEEEIFPLIFGLAGQKAPDAKDGTFSGYPLTADPQTLRAIGIMYYCIIPGMFIAVFFFRAFGLSYFTRRKQL